MNYKAYNCQLKSLKSWSLLFAILMAGCSTKPVPGPIKEREKLYINEAKPVWFNGPERFTSRNANHDIETHGFFDLAPFVIKGKDEINVVILTPRNSEFGYELDLSSGKKYKRFHYCKQNDVWGAYSGSIANPPFTTAFAPRILDSLGEPQRVILFGDTNLFETQRRERDYSQRVKVIGGLIIQYCKEYPCVTNKKWLSKQVLVAVNPFDPVYGKLQNIAELKKRPDWGYTKAFLENGRGSNISGQRREPAYRVIADVDGKRALKFAVEKGHLFSMKEINTLRSSCYKLYDYMWKNAERFAKKREENIKFLEELDKKMAKKATYRQGILIDVEESPDNSGDVTKKASVKKEVTFSKWFIDTYYKYGERYRTCSRFVRPANIQDNKDRHWFFAYITNFVNLENINYTYSCRSKGWMDNPVTSSGKLMFPIKRKRNCRDDNLEMAFDGGITFMAGVKNSMREHYRYIEYDMGIGGSHEKIHSWVPHDGKGFRCRTRRKTEKKSSSFPVDVSWKSLQSLSNKVKRNHIF